MMEARTRTTTLGFFLFGLVSGLVAAAGCSSSTNGARESLTDSESGGGGGASGGGVASPSSSSNGGGSGGQPGVLTAGIWDDNLNYSFFKTYLAAHQGQNAIAGDPGFAAADYDAANTQFAQRGTFTNIDAALVIDTTGSMGDEISYLTAEFANIQSAIQAAFPTATQRWALIVYRDTPDTDPGDAYVSKTFDFTANAASFAAEISAQTADNGGDYPESPEIGLQQLPTLSWKGDASTAKVAFWVADAPQHTYRAAQMKKAISDTLGAGIHLYPVSASGTDDLLEMTMRSAAQLTGGRYLFLTDDSGVGDPHKTPEIPCYFVTRLEKALVRVASMEITGTYIAPAASDIIRTDGTANPDGTCTTGTGAVVRIF